ncbi:MAG: hypothetical protein ACK50Y_01895 [Flavobacteriia bacterium]
MKGIKIFQRIIIALLIIVNVTVLMLNYSISKGEILLFHLSGILLYTLIRSSVLYVRRGFNEQIENQMH